MFIIISLQNDLFKNFSWNWVLLMPQYFFQVYYTCINAVSKKGNDYGSFTIYFFFFYLFVVNCLFILKLVWIFRGQEFGEHKETRSLIWKASWSFSRQQKKELIISGFERLNECLWTYPFWISERIAIDSDEKWEIFFF